MAKPGRIDQLIELAKSEGYCVHARYGIAPRVILFGFRHPDQRMIERDSLCHILSSSPEQGDIVLMEGTGPFEVVYDGYHRNDIIGTLKPIFEAKNIRTIFNDNDQCIADLLLLSGQLKQAEDNGLTGSEIDALKTKHTLAKAARDENFCLHESYGIVPFIKGTAKIWKPLGTNSSLYQIVGSGHLKEWRVYDILKRFNVPHISFLNNQIL